jgi:sodium-dependent dicarboxylate transporter 2/3/5
LAVNLPLPGRDVLALAVAAIVAVFALTVPADGLEPQSRRMLAVFLVAVVLWITEVVPLFATAALIILAEVLLVSDEAILSLPADFEAPAYATFYSAMAHPVIMLFLGGFFLADAAAKVRLDRNLAGVLLRPFSRSNPLLLAGLMAITALLSMFMSNSATTAAMMAVVVPVTLAMEPDDPFRTALVLAIPVAANVGGLGTPVGTPPNAIAVGRLADEGISIDFVEWMVLAVPLMIVILAVAWLALIRLFPSRGGLVSVAIGGRFERSRPATVIYATFAVTVLLWLSEPLHNVPAPVVAFLPVAVLLATRVFGIDDLKRLNWHVLWLVAGGIALGAGVAATGLDAWLIDLVDWSALSPVALIAGLVVLALAMSTVISNSATANLLIPLVVSLASSSVVDVAPALAAVVLASACSLAMALPVSTPPNAIAYATGEVATADLAKVGAVVGVTGAVLVIWVAPPLWDALGVLP